MMTSRLLAASIERLLQKLADDAEAALSTGKHRGTTREVSHRKKRAGAHAKGGKAAPRKRGGVPLFKEAVGEFERLYWLDLAVKCRGNISEMQRVSGVARSTVREYLAKHRLRSNG